MITINYQDAISLLNGRQSRKVGNNTYLHTLEAVKSINQPILGLRLHDTDIIKFYPDYAELFTGGWYTVTTKARLNEYSPVLLSQKANIWYIGNLHDYRGKVDNNLPLFYEGIKVDYSGNIISKVKHADKVEAENKKIKAKIKKYVGKLQKTLEAGKLEVPSGGDCWFCSMHEVGNMSLGDISKNTDHLTSHMEEDYIVPSLVWNAVKEMGYQSPEVIIGYFEQGKPNNPKYTMVESVNRAVTKYLQKRLLVKP